MSRATSSLVGRSVLLAAAVTSAVALGGLAGAATAPRQAQLPRHAVTPGQYATVAGTSRICTPGWPRNGPTVTLLQQKSAFARYRIPWTAREHYTLDLLVPRELGGTAGPRNLWPQPRAAAAGMRSQVVAKNQLEDTLRSRVCSHRLSLASARHQIGVNWVAAYDRYVGLPSVPPTTHPPTTTPTTTPPTTKPPTTSPPPEVIPPTVTVTVHDVTGLTAALRTAVPGTDIELADGDYASEAGPITITTACTATHPCTMHGDRGAVLDGTGMTTGGHYALHLQGAAYWTVSGLRVTDGNKGVVLDAASHDVLTGLEVDHVGDEGVHLRDNSSYDTVVASYVHDTGLVQPGFGEGIYVGSAKSNWGKWSQGRPDASNNDTVTGNTIAATTAENVDIKEGTVGGVVSANSFDASAISGQNSADSWVDVKGNNWLITGNHGANPTNNPRFNDGFQTHVQVAGDGAGNRFTANRSDMGSASGYAINVQQPDSTGNVVTCDNTVSGSHARLSDERCTPD
ncbi:hypothetical protein acdb102_19570 [Acidothermaceae bacterium B102]|nr:hypothetical protein acdb102_19570 [Acidothermaceae bacterium B102]